MRITPLDKAPLFQLRRVRANRPDHTSPSPTPPALGTDASRLTAPVLLAERTTPDPVVDDVTDNNLADEVRTGLRWSVSSQLAVRLVSFLSGIVVVSLLGDSSFGVYLIGLAVNSIAISLNDVGQVMAVARWPGDDHERAARTSTLIVWTMSAFLYAVIFFGAGPLSQITDRPQETAAVVRIMGLLVLIDAVGTVPRALLIRGLANAKIAKADLAGVPVNAALAMGLAAAGWGPYAPAWATIVAGVLTTALVLVQAPSLPRPAFEASYARPLLSFGSAMAGSTFVENLLLNADYLIIAATLDTAQLGLYGLAFNVASWPTSVLTQAIRRVSIVGFSRLTEDRPQLFDTFARVMGAMVLFAALVAGLLSGLADALVGFIYDDSWLRAARVLSWLALLGGIRVSLGLVFDLLIALGRSKDTLRIQLLWLAAAVPAIWFGSALGGIVGVGVAHAAVAVGVAVPAFLLAASRTGFPVTRLVASWRPVVVGTGVALAGSQVAHRFGSPLVALAVMGPTLTVVYLALALPPSQWKSWLRLEPLRGV